MSQGDVIGVILAGGLARRMGGDKLFVEVAGVSLIERTIARARPQVGELLINANRELDRISEFGVPIIADRVTGYLGPLAGIFSGLEWLRENRPRANWLATFACDCPFFPLDMVDRLCAKAAAERALASIAASGGRHHPVFAVWSPKIAGTSESVLVDEGHRKMEHFVASLPNTEVEFPIGEVDPFFNVNTPDELKLAESLMAGGAANR
jgi:molybdopterin-guanine dinucleotide biosynthesis protein A